MGFIELIGRATIAIILSVVVLIIFEIIYKNGYFGGLLDYGSYKYIVGVINGVIITSVMRGSN